MKTVFVLCALVALVACAPLQRSAFSAVGNPPAAPGYTSYTAEFFLSLPYVKISVPTRAVYDGAKNILSESSFGDEFWNLYRFDKGQVYSTYIAASTKQCQVSNQTASAAVISPVPSNLAAFTYIGQGECPDPVSLDGVTGGDRMRKVVMDYRRSAAKAAGLTATAAGGLQCDLWELDVPYGDQGKFAVARFSALVNTEVPIQFHVFGHNNVTESHFDTYVYDYTAYKVGYNPSDITPPTPCTPAPAGGGPQVARTVPMPRRSHLRSAAALLFPKGSAERIEHMFNDFVLTHSKAYATAEEHAERKVKFAANLDLIESHNSRPERTFTMAVNHLADTTQEERRKPCKTLPPKDLIDKVTMKPAHRDMLVARTRANTSNPIFVDWVAQGAVLPPKDQGWCGSCWTFGAVGAIEGFHAIQTGQLVSLSEQQIMDCSWSYNVTGCGGGDHVVAFQWLLNQNDGNLATDKSYPYTVTDGYCIPDSDTQVGAHFTKFLTTPSGDTDALVAGIAQYGPAGVAIDASQPTFSFYSHGLYYDPNCGNTINQLDHVVLAVGTGIDPITGQRYAKIKNSWSSYWGFNGFVRMSLEGNNCGVATEAAFIVA